MAAVERGETVSASVRASESVHLLLCVCACVRECVRVCESGCKCACVS